MGLGQLRRITHDGFYYYLDIPHNPLHRQRFLGWDQRFEHHCPVKLWRLRSGEVLVVGVHNHYPHESLGNRVTLSYNPIALLPQNNGSVPVLSNTPLTSSNAPSNNLPSTSSNAHLNNLPSTSSNVPRRSVDSSI